MDGRHGIKIPLTVQYESEEFRLNAVEEVRTNFERDLTRPNDFGFVQIVSQADGSVMSIRPEKIVLVSYNK